MYFYYNYQDIYDDLDSAAVQQGFERIDSEKIYHSADDGLNGNKRTPSMIIEKDNGKLNKFSIPGTFTC